MGLKNWAKQTHHRLRRDAHILWIAARDPRTPKLVKFIGGLTAAYVLSPIDLIPDFIPVLGLLDELILVPFCLWIAMRLIPQDLFDEYAAAAEHAMHQPVSRANAGLIIFLWVGIAAFVALQLWSLRYW